MYLKSLTAIGACAVLGVAAFGQSADLSKTDKAFLTMAADTNMIQAHLGQMAQNDASSADVKDYGQKLAQNHTTAYQELAELASKTGVTIPKGIDVRRERSVQELKGVKGTLFDRRFVSAEVRENERILAEFRREAEHGQNADVKAYASKMVPIMEDDLHTAERLAKAAKRS